MVYNGNMAVNELQPAEPRTKVLSNGAVYDLDKKRIVSSKDVTTKFTSARAVEVNLIKIDKKRERLMAGANAIVAKGGDYDGTDLDFVEAIGEAVTLAALDPTSSQQVKAAEFLFREAGIGERQAIQDGPSGTIGALADVIDALSAFAGSIAGLTGGGPASVHLTNIISNDESIDADIVPDVDSDTDSGSE